MILQALCELAKQEGLVDDPDYELKAVRWLVTLKADGTLVGIRCTDDETGHAKRIRIPRQPKRTNKVVAHFFCDNAQYVFGSAQGKDKSNTDRVRKCFDAFRARVSRARAEDPPDVGAVAVDSFLTRLSESPDVLVVPEELASNDNIAFVLDTDVDLLVTDRPAIEAIWRRCRRSAEDASSSITCLVSGQRGPAAGVHPAIKKLPGRRPETALVSFNKSAFWSYGWTQHENATISKWSSEAFSTALNRLLDSHPIDPRDAVTSLPRRNIRLPGDTVVCYWSSESSSAFLDVFDSLLNGNEESVAELYRSIWRGVAVEVGNFSRFYALTVSSNSVYVVVRDWIESTISRVAGQLAAHFRDLSIERLTPAPRNGTLPPQFPLRQLAEALCPEGKNDSVPPPLVSELFDSAITGVPYRFTVLQRAVERTRAEISEDSWMGLCRLDARAALIKAFLNRWKRLHPETSHYPEILPMLDPTNDSPGYLLGQLMAVLERAQQLAMDANATVVDRYFSGASASPRSVFVRLLKNSQHHLRKAEDEPGKAGTSFLLKRLIDHIADGFDPKSNGFPARLSLEQQGLFVLGYHQMRRWLWLNQEDRQRWEASCPELPSAYKWTKAVAA